MPLASKVERERALFQWVGLVQRLRGQDGEHAERPRANRVLNVSRVRLPAPQPEPVAPDSIALRGQLEGEPLRELPVLGGVIDKEVIALGHSPTPPPSARRCKRLRPYANRRATFYHVERGGVGQPTRC